MVSEMIAFRDVPERVEDRLIVALALPEGGKQLVVIDLAKGVRLGTIELHPVP